MHLDPDQSIRVTQDDLDFVRQTDPAADVPYAGVVRHWSGWRARAFRAQVGGVYPTPRAAAVAMVQWWKGEYGELWRAYWAMRQANGWRVVRDRRTGRCDVRVWVAGGGGGWLVREKRRWVLRADRPAVPRFDGANHARRCFRVWLRQEFGLFVRLAPLVIRRHESASHRPYRLTPVPVLATG